MSKKTYDFSGWATKFNIKCSDGRTIKSDAFKEQDGKSVPLVWSHSHNSADNVLGHALLENRPEGVYCYCSFNENESGKNAKELVRHGDIVSLSIFANKLKQIGGDVIHGAIREVSLVLAGANPGALIDNVMAHDGAESDQAEIYSGEDQVFDIDIEIEHSDKDSEDNDESDNQDEINHACGGENNAKDDKKKKKNELEHEKSIQDVFDSMTEEQQNVCYFMIGKAIEDTIAEKNETEDEKNKAEHSDKEDIDVMKENAFDKNLDNVQTGGTLSHDDLNEIIANAKKNGSLKNAFEEACIAHSVTNIGNLFPEVKLAPDMPKIVSRDMTWVQKVIAAVSHTPFSRVKSNYMDITADAARAKGYVKGNQKAEEVVSAVKRSTTPQTVYKLQKLDRDDVLDITDFEIIPLLKKEMRVLLDEELARAFLIGDGRLSSSNDKIDPTKIRPVWQDSNVYTTNVVMEKAAGADDYAFAKDFIRQVIKNRKHYKGAGSPSMFTTEDWLSTMLLIEDTNGHRIYKTEAELAAALRVKEIITVPVMDNASRADETHTYDLKAIIVNLVDYKVGADKGGNVNMFDDFDLNYNKYEYLIETRCSGALVTPYSALTFEHKYTTPEVVNG